MGESILLPHFNQQRNPELGAARSRDPMTPPAGAETNLVLLEGALLPQTHPQKLLSFK